jgi:copper chaperone
MIVFEVQDMSCGHCVASITKAVQALDAQAQVQVDLAAHRVQVESARTDAAQLETAIRDAGYTPVPVQAA